MRSGKPECRSASACDSGSPAAIADYPQPRSATVRAASPVRAFRLRKAAFDQALRMRPEIAAGVITELVRRLRETHETPRAR